MHPLYVKIDLDRLRGRLSREQGRPLDASEVHGWLHRAGFGLDGAWYCNRAEPLRLLLADELLEVVRDVVEDGVHFVDRHPPGGV